MEDDALIAQAQAWLAEDPDPDTREELARLIDDGNHAELAARFAGHPPVRHRRPPRRTRRRPLRMNRSVVIRAAAGLAAYLKKQGTPTGTTRPASSSSATTPATSRGPSPRTPPPS